MSVLTEAEHAYRQQRAAAKLAGPFHLRQQYRRLHAHSDGQDMVTLARLAALKDEFILRGLELPHVA